MLCKKLGEVLEYAVGTPHFRVVRRTAFAVSVPHHIGHVGQEYVEICIIDLLGKPVVLFRQGFDQIADILL